MKRQGHRVTIERQRIARGPRIMLASKAIDMEREQKSGLKLEKFGGVLIGTLGFCENFAENH